MRRFKHILFDCDGVIIDSEIVAARLMVEVFNEVGIDINLEKYIATFSGKTFAGIIDEFSKQNAKLDAEKLKEMIEETETKVYDFAKPIPGVKRAIGEIQFPKSVVSNSGLVQIKRALNIVEVSHFFENRLYSSEHVALPKPSPLIYLHAVEQIGHAVDEVIVVEDSAAGVEAAVKAGMFVIGFTGASHIPQGHGEILKKIGAQHIIDSMEELPKLISTIS